GAIAIVPNATYARGGGIIGSASGGGLGTASHAREGGGMVTAFGASRSIDGGIGAGFSGTSLRMSSSLGSRIGTASIRIQRPVDLTRSSSSSIRVQRTPTALGQAPTALGQAPTALGQAPTALGQPPTALGQAPTALGQAPTASAPRSTIGGIGSGQSTTDGIRSNPSTVDGISSHGSTIDGIRSNTSTVDGISSHGSTIDGIRSNTS